MILGHHAVAPLALLALLVVAGGASAQDRRATLHVVVHDSTERPIAAAIVTLEGHSRPQARTDDNGRATFSGVAAGRHRLRAVRVGYEPLARQLDIGMTDTTLKLVMRPTVARLAEVRVIASRARGVFGKVGRASDWAPVPGATVVAFGGKTVRTDSTGSFDLPEVRSGAHLIRVERAGFVAQMRSVTVPPSGAVELAFLLDSGRTPRAYEVLLDELGQRQRWRGTESATVPRGELARLGDAPLSVALRGSPSFAKKSLVLTDDACVFVNGEPKPGWSLDAFGVDQIEAVEVYAGRSEMSGTLGSRWPRGAVCGSGMRSPTPGSTRRADAVRMIVIWLKPDPPRQ